MRKERSRRRKSIRQDSNLSIFAPEACALPLCYNFCPIQRSLSRTELAEKANFIQDELRDGAAVLRFISTIAENGEDLVNDVEDFVEREETTPKSFAEDFRGPVSCAI